ncbi:unnamed protein product [Rhodiola kirilowii]
MRESIEQYGWDKYAFIRFSHQIFNSIGVLIGRFQLMLLFMLSARHMLFSSRPELLLFSSACSLPFGVFLPPRLVLEDSSWPNWHE